MCFCKKWQNPEVNNVKFSNNVDNRIFDKSKSNILEEALSYEKITINSIIKYTFCSNGS